jgi:TfoX/Sxy family transcriptional regulator of competence genes
MSPDELLAQRVRTELAYLSDVVEKRMFGGIGFLVGGNMACGVHRGTLIVRVGAGRHDEALARPHTKLFDMTGRPMTGWVVVEPEGYAADDDLRGWVRQGVEFALSLPGK